MKKRNLLLILISLFLFIPSTVDAKINYKFDDEVLIEENYKSSIFMFGNTLEANEKSDIEGISFLSGTKITHDGKTDYLALIAEELRYNGTTKKDAFVLANRTKIGGSIKRDLYSAGSDLYLTGEVGRNVKIYADTVKLEDVKIGNNVTIYANSIEMGDNVVIKGKLHHNENATLKGFKDAKLNEVTTFEVNDTISIQTRLYSGVKSVLSLIFVGLVMMFIMPKLFNKLDKEKVEGRFVGMGALALLLTPFIVMFLIITPFGLSLGLILFAMYIILLYLAQIISGFLIGKYVLENVFKSSRNIYLSLITGIAVLKILSVLPFIGVFISMFALLFGFGYLVVSIFSKK